MAETVLRYWLPGSIFREVLQLVEVASFTVIACLIKGFGLFVEVVAS